MNAREHLVKAAHSLAFAESDILEAYVIAPSVASVACMETHDRIVSARMEVDRLIQAIDTEAEQDNG
jgi:GTPase SAR1 family protein